MRINRRVLLSLLAGVLFVFSNPHPVRAQCVIDEIEPNDVFAEATPLPVNCLSTALTVNGEGGERAVDVFSLNQLFSPSDQFRAGRTPTSPVWSALFNRHGELLRRSLGGYFDHDFRENTDGVFWAARNGVLTRPYRSVLTRNNASPHPPVVQRVLLDFDGGNNIVIHNRSPITFPAFDATMLGARYTGQTAYITQRIVEQILAAYDNYGVEFYVTGGPQPRVPFSTVYFGGNDPNLLGLADSIDPYNTDFDENAIVYVEGFRAFEVMNLTADQISQMVTNVAAHEAGHLLGLYHTADRVDVMDTTGSVRDLVLPQDFTNTRLEESVFPVGNQNSPRLLFLTLGGNPRPFRWHALY